METIVNTIQGTFIVPKNKEAALINWLQANAIRQGAQNLGEGTGYSGQQYIVG